MVSAIAKTRTFVTYTDSGGRFRLVARWLSGERRPEPSIQLKDGRKVQMLNNDGEYLIIELGIIVRESPPFVYD